MLFQIKVVNRGGWHHSLRPKNGYLEQMKSLAQLVENTFVTEHRGVATSKNHVTLREGLNAYLQFLETESLNLWLSKHSLNT